MRETNTHVIPYTKQDKMKQLQITEIRVFVSIFLPDGRLESDLASVEVWRKPDVHLSKTGRRVIESVNRFIRQC